MEIIIKKANENNIKEMNACLYPSTLYENYFKDEENTKQILVNGINNECAYIATINNNCVGFMIYKPQGMLGKSPYLHILTIKEGYRNKGIGSKLLDYFENDVRENKVFLTVDTNNPKAINFYKKHNYINLCLLENYYKEGINCYLMMKEIN